MFNFSLKDKNAKLYQRIKKHLNKNTCNYVTAYLTEQEGQDAGQRELVVFYLSNLGSSPVQFFYLTGRHTHTGSIFGLDEARDFKLELVSVGPELVFRQLTDASKAQERAERIIKDYQRLPVFVDAAGTTWYFSSRSNVQRDKRGRGKTFVLHRDAPQEEEYPLCYRVFHTGLSELYDGHWVLDAKPEHSYDYRYHVYETDIDKQTQAKIDRRFPVKTREHLIMAALEKIGKQLNIPTGLEDYVKFCDDTFANANFQKQAAQNDPQCYYTPNPNHQPLDEQRSRLDEFAAGGQPTQGQDFSSCDETQDPG